MARRTIKWADLLDHGEFMRRTLHGVLHVENVTAEGETVFGRVEVSRVSRRKVYVLVDGAESCAVPDDNVIVTLELH